MNQAQEDLQRRLEEKFIAPSYLDNFGHSQHPLPKVSAIIPTYNRCPYTVGENFNPLGWCLESLLAQRGEILDEIIIIDDASRDYTSEIVSDFSKKSQIPIVYMRTRENIGSSLSRNMGVEKSKNDLVLFLDDDIIFQNEDAVFTAAYSFSRIENEGHNVGAMHIPVYSRTNRFEIILPIKGILNIDYKNSHIGCSTGSFPKERVELTEEDYFESTNILRPLEVNNLAGIFLCKRKAFLDVGGFSAFFPTPALGEEHELAQRLTRNNYEIFFNPEPNSAVIHFRYGRVEDKYVPSFVQRFDNLVQFSLPVEKMIEESNKVRENTGNSVSVEEAMYSYVFGRMMIFSSEDMSKRRFIERVKKEIIMGNNYSYSNTQVDSQTARENICLDAIRDAERRRATFDDQSTTKQVFEEHAGQIYQVGVFS